MADIFSCYRNPFACPDATNAITAEQADRMFDGAPEADGVVHWSWNIPSSVVLYSREWRRVLLRSDDDTVQTNLSSWWPFVHDDDVQPFLEAARGIVEGVTESYQTLFRVRRADGRWVWLLSRGRVVEKSGSIPLLVRGTLVDITFLRADAKFLHGNSDMSYPHRYALSQRQTETAGGGGSAPFSLLKEKDLQNRQPFPGTQIFSTPDEANFTNMEAERKTFVRDRVDRVFSNGLAIRESLSFKTNYGHNVTGEYFFWPEFDADGSVVAVTTQFWDQTDKIIAERRARLNEMRLEALHRLTQMSNAEEEDVLSFVMDSLVKLTGSKGGFLYFPDLGPERRPRMVWSQSHYAAVNGEDLPLDSLPDDLEGVTTDELGRPYQRVIRNGNCLQPVWTLFDERIKVLRYIASPVLDEGRVVCIAGVCNKEDTEYLEDDLLQLESFVYSAWLVLRRHEFVRELERAKEAAERANKVKDEFLANVSHELRTPLNGMLSMLQLLDLLPLNEQQRDYVRTASISGKALMRIISDILDFARIEAGKMRLQVEPFDYKCAFESSLSLFRQEAEERGLTFDVTLWEGIPASMLGDDARVRQILFNIVGNALKFTERGTISVESCLLPHGGAEHAWVYIAVRDTGIGIPAREQARVFEAFTQIDSSSTRKYAGTGLGLSIVRYLVGLMGGGITLESEEGKGTTVHLSLRFARQDDTAQAEENNGSDGIKETIKPLRILVADDDNTSRYAIQIFLRHLGHQPVCVPNGRLALEMLQLFPFDCLLTDIQMPTMDGLELISRIREGRLGDIIPTPEARKLLNDAIPGEYRDILGVPRDIAAVTVSAHTMRGDRERFLDAGMDFYISKPVIMKELSEVLCKIAAKAVNPDR